MKKNLLSVFAFLMALVFMGSFSSVAGMGSRAPRAEALRIAEDGRALAVIVVPDAPGDTEEFAASELQSYLEKISGAELPVVAESERGGEAFISVGSTRLAAGARERLAGEVQDAFVVESVPGGLVLAGGGSPGTLFAVYDFLERDLGCRWLGPGEVWEHVPRAKTLVVSPEDRLETPGFPFRQGRLGDEWEVRNKANMASSHQNPIQLDWYPERAMDRAPPPFELPGWSAWHSVPYQILRVAGRGVNLEERERMLNDHPEWFTLQEDGSRRPGWLCHLNPELNDLVADRLSQLLREKPQMDYVQLGEGDGYRPCVCEACLDMNAEGGMAFETARGVNSYRMRLWENTVAAMLAETDPGKKMAGVAYGSFQEPLDPDVIRPADNVMIEFTSWSQCRAHALEHEYEDETRLPEAVSHANTRDWIERWGAQTPAGVLYQEYIARNSMRRMTAPIPRRFVRDTHYLRRQGAVGYRSGTGPSSIGGFFIPNVYAARKAAWNPDLDPDELMRDFCDHAFHEGSEHMQAFLNVIEDAVNESNCDHCRLVAWTMDEERMAQARRHLDAAREAVAENEVALQRLLSWDIHFQFVALAGPAEHRRVGALFNVYGLEQDLATVQAALDGYQAAVDYADAARAGLIEKYGRDIMNRPDMRVIRSLGGRRLLRNAAENSPLRRALAALESGNEVESGADEDLEDDEEEEE